MIKLDTTKITNEVLSHTWEDDTELRMIIQTIIEAEASAQYLAKSSRLLNMEQLYEHSEKVEEKVFNYIKKKKPNGNKENVNGETQYRNRVRNHRTS